MTANISDRLEKRLADTRRPPKVLVIEDSREDAQAVSVALQRSGCDVMVAGTAESALQSLGASVPDLAMLDLKLPGMSGMELLRVFYDRVPPLHVVIMTDPNHLHMLQGHLRPTDYICIYMKPITESAVRKILVQHNLIQEECEDRLGVTLQGPSSP